MRCCTPKQGVVGGCNYALFRSRVRLFTKERPHGEDESASFFYFPLPFLSMSGSLKQDKELTFCQSLPLCHRPANTVPKEINRKYINNGAVVVSFAAALRGLSLFHGTFPKTFRI
jgi:hypothetical protein